MNKEIIEKYIQFGIDNGYMKNKIQKIIDIEFIDYNGNIIIYSKKYHFNLNIMLITSKKFIEAIARGLQKDKNKLTTTSDFNGFGWEVRRMYYKNNILVDVEYLPYTKDQENGKEEIGDLYKLKSFSFNSLIVGLTHKQADAIRDDKLEEFIENLLK